MARGGDDFTVILPPGFDAAACGWKEYEGLDRLWRMVERYQLTAPVAVEVVDRLGHSVREFHGTRGQGGGWQLEEAPVPTEAPPHGEPEFPLILKMRDAKGNILKMRLLPAES